MIEGGCFCGFVRYRAEGPTRHETLCHCTICRRTSGAPLVAWFTVPVDGFRFVRGEPAQFASSGHGRRSFCPRCGTPLTFRSELAPEEIDVTTASADVPAELPPRDHTHTRSRLPWLRVGDDLPAFEEARP